MKGFVKPQSSPKEGAALLAMTDHLRAAVSRNKRRYKCDGYNLDLSYIEPNIIAMGYPAEKLESIYRNQLDQVAKFLNEKHPDCYKIYNLCKERQKNNYPKDKFTGYVCEDFAFEDHAPPPLENIEPFCRDVQEWLSRDPGHVVAVHCKAGKGRTGVMICCYLLHCGRFKTAEEALQHYGKVRTVDEKGVTIPSQRRYVEYYAKMRNLSLHYEKTRLFLKSISFENIPFNNIGSSAFFTVYHGSNRKKTVNMGETKARGVKWEYEVQESIEVSGDVQLEFYTNRILKQVKEKICAVCFNTFFLDKFTVPADEPIVASHDNNGDSKLKNCQDLTETTSDRFRVLHLNKSQLDRACKTKEFPDKASVCIIFDSEPPLNSSSPAANGNFERHSEGGSPGEDESSDEDETSCVRM